MSLSLTSNYLPVSPHLSTLCTKLHLASKFIILLWYFPVVTFSKSVTWYAGCLFLCCVQPWRRDIAFRGRIPTVWCMTSSTESTLFTSNAPLVISTMGSAACLSFLFACTCSTHHLSEHLNRVTGAGYVWLFLEGVPQFILFLSRASTTSDLRICASWFWQTEMSDSARQPSRNLHEHSVHHSALPRWICGRFVQLDGSCLQQCHLKINMSLVNRAPSLIALFLQWKFLQSNVNKNTIQSQTKFPPPLT